MQLRCYDSYGGDPSSLLRKKLIRLRSLVVKKIFWIAAQIVWIAVCLLALIEANQGYRGASDWQVEEGLAFEMMALSFPSCFAVAIGLASTGAILGVFGLALPASSRFEMTGTWFLFVVAGYVQWFVLVPRFLVQRKRTAQPQ